MIKGGVCYGTDLWGDIKSFSRTLESNPGKHEQGAIDVDLCLLNSAVRWNVAEAKQLNPLPSMAPMSWANLHYFWQLL
jgi:hypothetical protein